MVRREVPPEEVPAHARELDGVFDALWVVEDLQFAGGISQLTAVLDATEKARVGHGIAPTPFRSPVALAMEWATIARMHPGRLVGGLGHGVQEWMRSIGAAVSSPMALLEEQLTSVRALLSGESVNVHGRYVTVDGVGLEFPPEVPVPVLAGVNGPKSLELSGRFADGTILGEGSSPEVVERAREVIGRGRASAGTKHPHQLVVFVAFHLGTRDDLIDGLDESLWRSVHDKPTGVIEDLESVVAAGCDSVVLVPIGRDPTADLRSASRLIVPDLRSRLTSSI